MQALELFACTSNPVRERRAGHLSKRRRSRFRHHITGLFAGALGVDALRGAAQSFVRTADVMQTLDARLRLATRSAEDFA